MINLVSMRPPQRMAAYPFLMDLQEVCGAPEGQSTIRLWEDAGGEIAAFALLDNPFITFDISPDAVFGDLAEQIIAWGVENIVSKRGLSEQLDKLVTNCREEDTQRLSFLEQQGFSAQPVRTLHFSRSLKIPIPAPRLPEDFLIRPIAGEEEVAAWLHLHHAAHRTENMTLDFRLSMMHTTEYRQELDLVAVAPDGQLAAYAMCHFSEEENRLRKQKVGYTDPVATHPIFQRQGLARALLFAGFERLKDFGMEFAEVSTWGENIGMIKTAESVGFQLYSTTNFLYRFLGGNSIET
jgi:mycothiol synthase